jgi:hypothetical protein
MANIYHAHSYSFCPTNCVLVTDHGWVVVKHFSGSKHYGEILVNDPNLTSPRILCRIWDCSSLSKCSSNCTSPPSATNQLIIKVTCERAGKCGVPAWTMGVRGVVIYG